MQTEQNRAAQIQVDAFSSGQISSKLWLCEQLENAIQQMNLKNPVLWILGGWYGLSAFLLLSRAKIGVQHVRSFDIDPRCESTADMINENWVWKNWQFKAFTADCRILNYQEYGPPPQVVINTSTEHMGDTRWWDLIPPGTLVALQSCDMDHADHCFLTENLESFAKLFPLAKILFQGEKEFVYPEWKFRRFMRIGLK